MSSLEAFMSTNASDVKDPVELVKGQYRFTVVSYRAETVGENQNTKVTIKVKATDVVDAEGFDADSLAEAMPVFMEYWGTDKSLAQPSPVISLKQFLVHVLELPESLDFNQLLEMAISAEFVGLVDIKMEGKDKDRPTPRVVRIIL
jgi:hypothetical protein